MRRLEGTRFGAKVVEALGLRELCRSIKIEIATDSIVTVTTEHDLTAEEGERLLKLLGDTRPVVAKTEYLLAEKDTDDTEVD